jgi:SAM-dependent methyltransferase
VFLYNNLLRVVEERRTLAERAKKIEESTPARDPASLLDRSSFFHDRGLSLDTGIIPGFVIEQALRDLKQRGALRGSQVTRVAVIGPGLDFIDKNEESAFDYYPQQTLQPFALYDSLVRLGLAKPDALSLAVFDISPRVIEHLKRARERATKKTGYTVQLPRDLTLPWPEQLLSYWHSLGDRIGIQAAPIKPPTIFRGLETRAIEVRPDVVLACNPLDLNIVVERLNLPAAERFDLIVGTNIFVYYDAFEQSLALANAGAMLKPGGLLLTNDRLPALSATLMQLDGVTTVPFDVPAGSPRQAVGWYRKLPEN